MMRREKREERGDMCINFLSHMWHGWAQIKGIFYLKMGLLFTICLPYFVSLLHVCL